MTIQKLAVSVWPHCKNPPWLHDLACIWLTTLVTAIRPDLPNFYCSGLVVLSCDQSNTLGGPVRINGWQADPVAKCQGSLWFQCNVQIKNCELFRRVKSRSGLHTRVEPKYLEGTAPRVNCSLRKQVDLALLEPLLFLCPHKARFVTTTHNITYTLAMSSQALFGHNPTTTTATNLWGPATRPQVTMLDVPA